jgi:hypothetical protein
MAKPHWGKLQNKQCRESSLCFDLPVEMRLFLLVCGEAEATGHAYFGQDGLAQRLPRSVDTETGEVRSFTPRYLYKLLQRGKDAGLYAPQSTLRCIVLSYDLWNSGAAVSARPCPEHGHNLAGTSEGEWLDPGELAVDAKPRPS